MKHSKSYFRKRILPALICGVIAISMVIPSFAGDSVNYYSSYGSLDEVRAASLEINKQIGEESVVLMKNKDNVLPLEGVKFVSVFGKAAEDPFYAGGGSGTAEGYYPAGDYNYTSVYDSLEAAGFSVNPSLRSFYEKKAAQEALSGSTFSYSLTEAGLTFSGNRAGISDVDPAEFTGAVLDSYDRYGDAAIIVLGRTGSEGGDKDMGRSREAFVTEELIKLEANGYDEATRETYKAALEEALDTNPAFEAAALRHGLQLTWEEEQLVKHVAENFDKVIVVLNSPEQIELGWVEDESLGDIDACMWVGHPGLNGFIAIGEVLTGEVNPSGRLVDIWQADMLKDPTYPNIMTDQQTEYGTSDYTYTDEEGEHVIHAIEYEEGIYYGYRYYETAAYEGFIDYDEAVVYPFGYGLSYTSFEKTLDSVEKKTDEDGNVYYEITATVTNTGAAEGKEVVEVYYTAPYTPGGIEKAYVVLGAFDKTKLLQPGQSETLVMTIYEQDMASYDYNDANANGHIGYELDGGDYVIKLMNNSHDVIAEETVAIEAQNFDTDRITGATVENLFSDVNDPTYNSLYVLYDEEGNVLYDGKGGLSHDMVLMSRADFAGTFPTAPTVTIGENGHIGAEGQLVFDIDEKAWEDLNISFTPGGTEDEADEAWYPYLMGWYEAENADGQVWDQGVLADPVLNLNDMTGKSWDDPDWITFLNQLSWDQLSNFLCYSGYWSISLADDMSRRKGQSLESTGIELVDGQNLGVPYSEQADGPVALKRQQTGSGGLEDVGIQWTSTMNIAATWNTDLAEIRGIMIGEEGLALELDGWYGVAMNIHRSPWGGRNFEYFAEDPLLSGKIAAAEVLGVQSKGVIAFIKHYAGNHQDTDRGPGLPGMVMPGQSDFGLVTFMDEQTLRECYTKSFQIAVEEGGALGLMNSMNHIGIRGNSNNFNLMTALLREEWGFLGYTVTDIVPAESGSPYADPETLPRIGADLPLNANSGIKVAGDWDAAEKCVKVDGVRNDVAWAAVRMCVKRVMYVNANSSVMRNSLDLNAFGANGDLSVTIGVAAKASVAVDPETLGTSDVTYTLYGDLPAGVTFDKYTGTFSGTPSEDGSYPLMVTMAADGGWIKDTKSFTMSVVQDLFEISALTGKVGEEFSGKIGSEALAEEETEVSYTAEGLPEGIILSEDGTFSGVPAAAGIYDAVITAATVADTGDSSGGSGGGSSGDASPSDYTLHVTFEIAE